MIDAITGDTIGSIHSQNKRGKKKAKLHFFTQLSRASSASIT
jgi:hypothetical protein